MAALTFTKNTSKQFIYSNCPEVLEGTNWGKKYTVERQLDAGIYYEFEWFHRKGYVNEEIFDARVGLVLKNTSGNTATITVDAMVAIKAAGQPTEPATYACANLISRYLSSEGATTFTLPGGSSTFVKYIDVRNGEFALGKIRLKSNISNVVSRIVFSDPQGATLPASFFDSGVTKASETISGRSGQQFSGIVGYSELTANVNVASNNSFILCEHVSGTIYWTSPVKPAGYNNDNEYQASTSCIPSGKNFHAGNYGILYNINLTNASGKTLRIYSTEAGASNQNMYLYIQGAWAERRISTGGTSIALTTATQTMKVYHPGGNFSNYLFQFV